MKTFSAKPSDIKPDWLLVDGTDKILGRLVYWNYSYILCVGYYASSRPTDALRARRWRSGA